jgi:hypothetical protein
MPAKLLSRHWVITDANGKTQEVKGEGTATTLLRSYCATDMLVFAIRTYEPWTWSSALGGLALLLAGVAVLIVTKKLRNR